MLCRTTADCGWLNDLLQVGSKEEVNKNRERQSFPPRPRLHPWLHSSTVTGQCQCNNMDMDREDYEQERVRQEEEEQKEEMSCKEKERLRQEEEEVEEEEEGIDSLSKGTSVNDDTSQLLQEDVKSARRPVHDIPKALRIKGQKWTPPPRT